MVASRTPWTAVCVVTTKAGCEAVRSLAGRRFLVGEAPRLPLQVCPSCDACPCVYRKYRDRRAGPRRDQEESGIYRNLGPGKERRVRPGRRETD